MPYVFSDWEHCTDPAGNARTLDWSEAGMRGQPPGLYLEALRQAATQRAATDRLGYVHPGLTREVVPMCGFVGLPMPDDPGEFLDLSMLLWHIDGCAWDLGSPRMGWLHRSALDTFLGSSVLDISGIESLLLQTEGSILEASGHTERIPIPTRVVGGFPGAYLRQLRDIFIQKTVYYYRQSIDPGAIPPTKIRECLLNPPGSWSDLSTALASVPWSDSGASPQFRVETSWISTSVRIVAGREQWIRGIYPVCKHVTGYLYPTKLGRYFYNPYYPHLLESTWCKEIDDVEIEGQYLEGDYILMEDLPSTPPSGWSAPAGYSGGFYFTGLASVGDYREDFTLGLA